MKILIADQFSELGGAQRVLLELLPALQTRGWQCVLAIPGRGPLRTRAEMLGVRCEEIICGPFGCGAKSISDVLKFGAQFPGLRSQFRRLIDEFRPDIFYVNAPRLVPAACTLGKAAPPILFHLHSYLTPRYAVVLTGRLLRRARASIIGNCNYVLEPLRDYFDDSRAEVIYNGVPDCGYLERKPGGRIGMIGRICPEKGQKVFVQAARELSQLSFVICGGTQFDDLNAQTYRDEVRELARGLPVEFTGWSDDICSVLHSLDLLVVASMPLAEATTRVILEAYSAGVPVLASDLPGIREILKDSETGFLFPPGDAGALAGRMRELMSAPPRLAVVAANARRCYEEHFRIDVFQRRMIASLEEIAKT